MACRRTIDVDELSVDLRGGSCESTVGPIENPVKPPHVWIADRYQRPASVRTHETADTHDDDLSVGCLLYTSDAADE